MSRVFQFMVDISKVNMDIPYGETFPVYDEAAEALVGSFLLRTDGFASVFVGGSGYPTALSVSTGDDFWFTLIEGKDGKVSLAKISQMPISVNSIKIRYSEET